MNGFVQSSDQAPALEPSWLPPQNYALSPASALEHPADVLNHPRMTTADKRAVLASWASDACAVKDAPALRQLDSGAVVGIDDILQALQSLDVVGDDADSPRPDIAWSFPFTRRQERRATRWRSKSVRRTRRSDDDDDPPPCPAAAARPVPMMFTAACAERLEWAA